ncbi:transcriptional regulator WhiB [Flexivirga endophytica]|uniref:Transcriptional regulator WhiB n=1 Tax=Flexivirga endophytica TaxID=1849103 RepID=A0A916TJF5_9MICO|nr:WhiB family transcriptional regulator [Flexivirga endophytica]GGB48228.1 transcriptional regulator WhiB [Flexivirga endophytica]GHB61152.1 transcriptional regulator WhiB [Flexivirga endophytica]
MVVNDWRERAACREENPELFFPVGTTGPALDQIEQAKDICRHCPVLAQCLATALDNGEDAGIWGGTTPEERRMMRWSRAKRVAGLDAVRRELAAADADAPARIR